jgi:ubiquinol-cytochrome c reductase cytochrome c1 subunit
MKTTNHAFRALAVGFGLALCISFTAGVTSLAMAAGKSNVHLDDAHINLKDKASLQRGARSFVNNCLNCHSAQFMRWGHLTQIGLTEEQVKEYLVFNPSAKMGDYMTTALDPKDAKEWFGGVPPDLTLVARSRGSDWIYTFLRSFYVDPSSPTGWGNEVFVGTSMPHVLHDLQGSQAKQLQVKDVKGAKVESTKLVVERPGTMTPQEYDLYVRDLVNYMTFMAEPARAQRTQMGVIVLLFITVLFFAALLLKNEYWKDVK